MRSAQLGMETESFAGARMVVAEALRDKETGKSMSIVREIIAMEREEAVKEDPEIIAEEKESRSFIAAIQENLEDARPLYDFSATQKKLDALDRRIRTVKHAVNIFNTTHMVPDFDMTIDEVKAAGMEAYFVDHTAGVYPQFASGTPWTAATMAVKGDVITDLTEDMGAEQKARTTYDNILRLSDDPDVNNVIRFLREREVVHFQRFGEALRMATERMDQKNVYAVNPAFDR